MYTQCHTNTHTSVTHIICTHKGFAMNNFTATLTITNNIPDMQAVLKVSNLTLPEAG